MRIGGRPGFPNSLPQPILTLLLHVDSGSCAGAVEDFVGEH